MSETPRDKAKSSNVFSKISKAKLIGLISVLTVLIACVGFLSYAGTYSAVYPNTYINQTPVGGMSEDELISLCQKLSQENSVPQTLNLSINGETFSIDSSYIDLEFDCTKTAVSVLKNRSESGFFGNVSAYFGSLLGEKHLNMAMKFNAEKFNKLTDEFISPYEIEPHDASYVAENGKLTIKKGNNGKKLDQNAMISEIEKNINAKSAVIPLVIAKVEGKSFDTEALFKELSTPPKDAYYEKNEDGEVIVIADKPQVSVDKSALKKAIESGKSTSTVSAKIIPAKVTKKDLEDALFSGVMGTWTSHFSASNVPRTANVALSASKIDGKILMPGESFSYDKTVGPRTAENGFKVAGVYINNKVENGIGGGICQTSSTLYSAVLYANLEIVSRTSHSLPVSYMPPGQDATIASGAIDFVFRNNTDYPIKITAKINGGDITCSIIGTPVKGQKVVINNTITANYEPKTEVETDASIPKGYKKTVKGSGGCAVSSSRTIYQDGKVVKTEPLTRSVYHATPHTVTVNPDDKGTPPESLLEQGAISEAAPEDIELNGVGGKTEETRPAVNESDIIIEI